jgi:hypothetical protein
MRGQNRLSNDDFLDPEESEDFALPVGMSIAADNDYAMSGVDPDDRFQELLEKYEGSNAFDMLGVSWDVNQLQRGGRN